MLHSSTSSSRHSSCGYTVILCLHHGDGHVLYLGHGGAALGLLLAAHLLGDGVALLLRHSLQQNAFIAYVLCLLLVKWLVLKPPMKIFVRMWGTGKGLVTVVY